MSPCAEFDTYFLANQLGDSSMTVRKHKIRITDLRRPVLSEAQLQARANIFDGVLEQIKGHSSNLTAEAVLEAAQKITGIEYSGSADFRERLQLSLESLDKKESVAKSGALREYQFGSFVNLVCIRLRLQDLLRCHPEIHDQQIRRPIIIVGPPRSGTTHLQSILAADPRLRTLRTFERHDPIMSDTDMATLRKEGKDPRAERYSEIQKQEDALLPYFSLMHPNEYTEEFFLQYSDFPILADTYYFKPSQDYNFALKHNGPRYEYMKTVIKALQWQEEASRLRRQEEASRWVLKSPLHSEYLLPLLESFPDATIVITYRDPVAVIQSASTLEAYRARVTSDEVNLEEIVKSCIGRLEGLLRALSRDRQYVPQDRLVEVNFHDLVCDVFGTIERIYETADIDFDRSHRESLKRLLSRRSRYKHGSIDYSLRRDFGVDPEKVRDMFSFYRKMFSVRDEVL